MLSVRVILSKGGVMSGRGRSAGTVLRTVTGRWGAWLLLLTAVIASAVLIGVGGTATTDDDPAGGLPAEAESAQVTALRQQFPSGRLNPALVVYARDGAPLTEADRRVIAD